MSHIIYRVPDNFQGQGILTPNFWKWRVQLVFCYIFELLSLDVCRRVIFELFSWVNLIAIILYYTHLWLIDFANTFSMRPLLTILLINKIWIYWQCPWCLLIWFNWTFLNITLSTLFSTENWIIWCIFSQVHSLYWPLNYIKI